jgi:hypothetical protein
MKLKSLTAADATAVNPPPKRPRGRIVKQNPPRRVITGRGWVA